MDSTRGVPGPASSEASSSYRALFVQSALGMAVADANRRLIDCNDAFCRIVGRPRDELIGRPFSEFSVPGDPDVGGPELEKLIAGVTAFSFEKPYRRSDGTTTWLRVNLSVLSREQDLYAGIIEDISDRKQAEAARELAREQLSEKTGLLARAHDIAKLGTFVIDSRAARCSSRPSWRGCSRPVTSRLRSPSTTTATPSSIPTIASGRRG